jgi:hypothetical protein
MIKITIIIFKVYLYLVIKMDSKMLLSLQLLQNLIMLMDQMKWIIQVKCKCQKIQKLMEMMKVIQVKLKKMKLICRTNLSNKSIDIKNQSKIEILNFLIIENFNWRKIIFNRIIICKQVDFKRLMRLMN